MLEVCQTCYISNETDIKLSYDKVSKVRYRLVFIRLQLKLPYDTFNIQNPQQHLSRC